MSLNPIKNNIGRRTQCSSMTRPEEKLKQNYVQLIPVFCPSPKFSLDVLVSLKFVILGK